MSAELDAFKAKVQTILTSNFSVGLSPDGDFTIAYDSVKGWVRPFQTEGGSLLVKVEAPLLFAVPETPELYKYIAIHTDDYFFGHLWCQETPDGIMVLFTHILLGDYLDEEELLTAIKGVVGTGNEIDDELQGMFGGKRIIDG